MAGIMIAGTNSGCGKTTVTLAVLGALKARGLRAASFKCGPDYIDPMFHKRVLNIPAYNLDPFFLDGAGLRALFTDGSMGSDISVVEGVMGYYDGVSNSPEGSCYTVARSIGLPVVLVVSCDGIANSVGAIIAGYKNYAPESRIAGVIFNHLPKWRYENAAETARSVGVRPLGCLPVSEEFSVGSRHLGLVTAGELENLGEMLEKLGRQAEETLDIDGLLELASEAEPSEKEIPNALPETRARIAVSRDEAFCFMYDENIARLRQNGCEIVYFSPLHDKKLPEGIGGMWLCGGYPELYAGRLEENAEMRKSIKDAVLGGLPTVAECGGFMYLNRHLTDKDGEKYEMAGVIDADIFPTDRLVRFGYLTIEAKRDNLLGKAGAALRVHEFHYWDSTDCGAGFTARAAAGGKTWNCVHSGKTLYAGFPHLYLPSAPGCAESFTEKAEEYSKKHRT